MKVKFPFLVLCSFVMFISCSDDDNNSITGEGIFTTPSDEFEIEGELFLPEGEGPFPSMIIVPGSGNEPREVLEPFVDLLNSNGYALYLYDKRGVGQSTGSYPPEANDPTAFLDARANDIVGIVALLLDHEAIDATKIGLLGSSQGAWVNSLVHKKTTDLAYIVMVSGGIASTGKENLYCSLTDDPNVSIDEAIDEIREFDGEPGFDPLPIIRDMSLPVLWIYGNEDRSHPSRYDVEVLEELGKNNFTVLLYENADHEMIDSTTGEIVENLFDDLGMWLMANN